MHMVAVFPIRSIMLLHVVPCSMTLSRPDPASNPRVITTHKTGKNDAYDIRPCSCRQFSKDSTHSTHIFAAWLLPTLILSEVMLVIGGVVLCSSVRVLLERGIGG